MVQIFVRTYAPRTIYEFRNRKLLIRTRRTFPIFSGSFRIFPELSSRHILDNVLYYNCKQDESLRINQREMTMYENLQKSDFTNLTTDEIYEKFGTKEKRGSTSVAIRTLLALSYTRSEVAKMLNIRYQHVRNVQLEPVKKTN
jgi:hypothetical protein